MSVFGDTIHNPAMSSRERPSRISQALPRVGMASVLLDVSESRTYDAALEITGAYKLAGNFPLDLEIVLANLGVIDEVTFEIEPKSRLSDCRHVEFRLSNKTHADRFSEMMRSVRSRIGFDGTPAWWIRLLRYSREPVDASGSSITTSEKNEAL